MDPEKKSPPPPISDEQRKAFFQELSRSRKERGIKNGRFSMMCDANAVVSMNEFWDSWVRVLGKSLATDYMLVAMLKAHEALRAALVRKRSRETLPKVAISMKKEAGK